MQKKHLQFIGFCLQYNWIFSYRFKDLSRMAVKESIWFGFSMKEENMDSN